jgi:hypothetical protein
MCEAGHTTAIISSPLDLADVFFVVYIDAPLVEIRQEAAPR